MWCEESSDAENSESSPRGSRALHPQWAHPGSRCGRAATPLGPRSKQATPHAGFARGQAGGPRGGAVSGPVRSGRAHAGALPRLYPRVDRARKSPTVGAVSVGEYKQDEYEDDTQYKASRSRFLPGKSVCERKEAIMTGQETRPLETAGAAKASSVPHSWSPTQALFRKEGEYWTLGYAGHLCRLKDTQGLAHLAQLLRSPGTEFH